MRLTIIPIDGTIGINNYFFSTLDLSNCNIPLNIHALQWYETNGELEFIDNIDRTKPNNEIIDSLPEWAHACVELWNKVKAHEDALIAEDIIDAEIPTTNIL